MNEQSLELLSAFLDGEEIAPEALAEALTAEGAREALLDFALLRSEIDQDRSVPGDRITAEIRSSLTNGMRRHWWSRAVPVPASALAAVLVLAVGLSIWAGFALRGDRTEAPPEPDRVIRFEPGVDWQEREG